MCNTNSMVAHKLREALGTKVHTGEEMEGTVEVDGAYFGGHIRPHKVREKRVDRRLKKHQTVTRRVVVAFREHKGRTLPFITKSEAQGVELAKHITLCTYGGR